MKKGMCIIKNYGKYELQKFISRYDILVTVDITEEMCNSNAAFDDGMTIAGGGFQSMFEGTLINHVHTWFFIDAGNVNFFN